MLGYKMVSANEKVAEIPDVISEQERMEDYLTPYGYTFDNPNIVVNPYGDSPLTAMILFETEKEEEVNVKVEGIDENSTYTNTYEQTLKHYIPVYGLYPNKKNKIHITCGKQSKIIEIETDPLPEDLKQKVVENYSQHLYFVTGDNYPYAVDSNQEVRWYLTKKYSGKIDRLTNGHLLLGLDSSYYSSYASGVVEIDLFGKIYKQYNLEHGYYGSYAETDTSLFLLSDSILEFDKQSGDILSTIPLDDVYQTISYDSDHQAIIVVGEREAIQIELATKKQSIISQEKNKNKEQEINLPLYPSQENYKIIKGVKYTNVEETPVSTKNIFLVGYQEIDEDYQKYQIKITKTTDNLQVMGDFSKQEVYVILDKFMDKRVYEIKDKQVVINKKGVSGKYSIYIKINDTIYKTNTYLEF